ncbi:hypothetical protein BJ170DRAFT_590812 [Xylariales sp. AK1849]|nr:hypothetical protein BJ170DRAFT_590812 [Xylariales sp. AK1849]
MMPRDGDRHFRTGAVQRDFPAKEPSLHPLIKVSSKTGPQPMHSSREAHHHHQHQKAHHVDHHGPATQRSAHSLANSHSRSRRPSNVSSTGRQQQRIEGSRLTKTTNVPKPKSSRPSTEVHGQHPASQQQETQPPTKATAARSQEERDIKKLKDGKQRTPTFFQQMKHLVRRKPKGPDYRTRWPSVATIEEPSDIPVIKSSSGEEECSRSRSTTNSNHSDGPYDSCGRHEKGLGGFCHWWNNYMDRPWEYHWNMSSKKHDG